MCIAAHDMSYNTAEHKTSVLETIQERLKIELITLLTRLH